MGKKIIHMAGIKWYGIKPLTKVMIGIDDPDLSTAFLDSSILNDMDTDTLYRVLQRREMISRHRYN